jgi:hypothetical protein
MVKRQRSPGPLGLHIRKAVIYCMLPSRAAPPCRVLRSLSKDPGLHQRSDTQMCFPGSLSPPSCHFGYNEHGMLMHFRQWSHLINKLILKLIFFGGVLGVYLVVECVLSMGEALGSIPSTKHKIKKARTIFILLENTPGLHLPCPSQYPWQSPSGCFSATEPCGGRTPTHHLAAAEVRLASHQRDQREAMTKLWACDGALMGLHLGRG